MTAPFIHALIADLKTTGHHRTAETYLAALNAFLRFRQGDDIPLSQITPAIIRQFESWLANKGICQNTSSFYMRILRAAYNRAVKQGLTPDRKPFRDVYTGVKKTIKRAISLKTIRRMHQLNLKKEPQLEFARDVFILSFMLRGMSFIDMCLLKKSQLNGDTLTYRRQKTGQPLTIRITPQINRIIQKYPTNPTERLLPILTRHSKNIRSAYRNKSAQINAALKQLMPRLGLSQPLTLYVARHSWASAAQSKGIQINTISQAMGHDSIKTTQIYLQTLSNETIDRANDLILSAL